MIDNYFKYADKRVTVICCRYIYCGILRAWSNELISLDDCSIVYATGPHDTDTWEDAKPLPSPWFVSTAAIESLGIFK